MNPEAIVTTSFKFYQGHTFNKLYFGLDYCWINEGSRQDHITIQFKDKFLLKGYIIRSGASLHPEDKIPFNSTLEVKIFDKIKQEELESKKLYKKTEDGYFEIEKINESGDLSANFNQSFWYEIISLRLKIPMFTTDKWILIYEFGIF